MKLTYIYKIIFFTIIIGLISCDSMSYKNKPEDVADQNVNEWNESKHPNLKPMYGNVKKTPGEKLHDEEFINSMLNDYKDKTTSAKKLAQKGWYYYFHNVIDTAMFRFNQSWLMDSSYAESYFGFAAIREYQGLNNEAEQFYQLAYKHDKTDTLSKQILNKIADIKEQQKDTTQLINAFQRAYNKFPNNGIASGKLGYFYSTINKKDSALKYYNITIAIEPEYEQTYLNRAWLYYMQGDFNQAIADYTKVIEKNKQSVYAYASRSNVLIDNKQYELAISDINHCIILDPNHPNFHFAKAECYRQLKQDKNACEEIKRGIQKGGKYNDKLEEYNCE